MDYRNQILIGDCIARMRDLPAGCVQTCVTSPPYWGLRDYQAAGQLGMEKTPEAYIANMVAVFAGVRRAMRDDGTLWLNIGDSYSANGGAHGGRIDNQTGVGAKRTHAEGGGDQAARQPPAGLKSGDQVLIPHRVALALQADGWYLRSTIIWHKRSPIPESVSGWRWVPCKVKISGHQREVGWSNSTAGRPQSDSRHTGPYEDAKWQACPGCDKCRDNNGLVMRQGKWRPTTGHEYIFLFSKSERYFCDGDAVQEAVADASRSGSGNKTKRWGANHTADRSAGTGAIERQSSIPWDACETRNPRSVWTLSSEPFKGAHFATFPSEIPRRAISAGTSSAGCCSKCGTCWAPVVESKRVPTRSGADSKVHRDPAFEFAKAAMAMSYIGTGVPIPPELRASEEPEMRSREEIGNRNPQRHIAVSQITGYRASCRCNAPAQPCLVLDPFGGSGTTAQVARHLGRDYVITELNPEYVALAEKRIATPLRDKTKKPAKKKKAATKGQRMLNF